MTTTELKVDLFTSFSKLSLTSLAKRINLSLANWRKDLYTPVELLAQKNKIPGMIEEGFINIKAADEATQYLPYLKNINVIPCNWFRLYDGSILDIYSWIYLHLEPTTPVHVTDADQKKLYSSLSKDVNGVPKGNIKTFKPIFTFADVDFPGKYELWAKLNYSRYLDIYQLYWLLNHKDKNILGESEKFIYDITVENNYQRFMSSATYKKWIEFNKE